MRVHIPGWMVLLLAFLLAAPIASSAQGPEATPGASTESIGGAWQVTETRELNTETRYAALSPDGQQMAGVGPDGTICVWEVETLESECAGERMPIRAETIVWAPDGTAVAFALDTIRLLYESDIYVYELTTGDLVNLTDDGLEGDLLENMDQDPPADDVPVWSPDSRQLAFARSFMGDDGPGSTSIMRIDR
ncbi:MAG TPA: DPP IV N-terminal domain-containing protein, partial [Thermomicrobiales bacterium]|nr:DPP IV N-terminal domain-containing protein [Thermomicrobiales bacterium]